MAKKKGGLDALFSKVFADENVKGAIASLHSAYAPSVSDDYSDSESPLQSVVDHIVDIETGLVEPQARIIKNPLRQSSNQAIKQTKITHTEESIKQSISHTDDQTVTQASNQTNKQAINQSQEQAVNQAYQQFSNHSDSLSSNQTSNQFIGQYSQQAPNQSVEQSIRQSNKIIPIQSTRQKWYPLNENQGRTLLFLYEKGGGLTNMDIVVAETGIAYGTARACIDVLMREGYVTHKARHNGHSFRGFEYSMNNHLCSLYVAGINNEQTQQTVGQSIRQLGNHSNNQTMRQSSEPAINQTNAVVSSFINHLKPTTTEVNANEDFLRDPELGYWKEKGVNNRQINSWVEEFQMPVDQVIQSLKYCRYDMVVLNLEEEKQISNPMNWFYKVMQRSGLYPKPSGYKSLAEIRAEQMEQAAQEAAEARERQAAAQMELAFQKLMSNPDSDEYRRLLDAVDDFSKDVGGKVLETALREAFRGSSA